MCEGSRSASERRCQRYGGSRNASERRCLIYEGQHKRKREAAPKSCGYLTAIQSCGACIGGGCGTAKERHLSQEGAAEHTSESQAS